MRRFRCITLGCKVNQYESAYLSELIAERGWEKARKDEKADLIIINTCIVTQKASHQSRQEIRKAIRQNPNSKVIVTGCYAQVYPEELVEIDGIWMIVGNKEKHIIPEIVEGTTRVCGKVLVSQFFPNEQFPPMPISSFPERSRAFLKIQDGCQSFCSYCIVPYARGPYRSMEIRDVIVSMERLMKAGYKEIVLTGIHLGKYGIDKGYNLKELLSEIGKQGYGNVRIRLSSMEPNEISDDILNMMAEEEWLCKHLHIPIQSGDDGILRRMKRPYGAKDFYGLVLRIKDIVPYAAIGTDIMVGFPGEDERAYNNTFKLIEELPISYLHVFPYSDRPGTRAYMLNHKVMPDVIKMRASQMRQLGKQKKRAFIETCIGKRFQAIVQRKTKDGFMEGLTENYIRVLLSNAEDFEGELVNINISKIIKGETAIGELLNAP